MAMMMSRRPGGQCACKACVTPGRRESVRGSYRAREKRQWRKNDGDLPQGESWLQDTFETVRFGGVGSVDDLSYWEAMYYIEEIDDYPTPPGFHGVWSTDSAHAVLMRKNDRMSHIHDALHILERAHDGYRYAKEMTDHKMFEWIVT